MTAIELEELGICRSCLSTTGPRIVWQCPHNENIKDRKHEAHSLQVAALPVHNYEGSGGGLGRIQLGFTLHLTSRM